MKTFSCLLFLFLAPLLCPGLYAQQDSQATPRVLEPPTRPPLPIAQALTLAEGELATRGLAASYFIKTVTLVRAPRMADSFYLAILDPIDPAAAAPDGSAPENLHREFKIDMRGTLTFREIPTRRVKVQQ